MKENLISYIDKLEATGKLSQFEFQQLIENVNPNVMIYAQEKAQKIRHQVYGNDVYIRGLIEFTNYCKNNCYYCGIRRGNKAVSRYRLTLQDILACAKEGYALGFRTFVLQGGEDPWFTPERMAEVILSLKEKYPDCAVTLSVGEQDLETYRLWKAAGANRFLLRHETANEEHYGRLHPPEMQLAQRKQCLYDLKSLGYQVGTGFMVGSPRQTAANLAEDMMFIQELQPEMVGIGPFIPHHETPFANEAKGSTELTVYLLSLLRIMLPQVLLPSTTALGTADNKGREKGILAGGNVVMPNLSPLSVRKKYLLYDGKISTGDEAAESVAHLKESMAKIGYQVVEARGDHPTQTKQLT